MTDAKGKGDKRQKRLFDINAYFEAQSRMSPEQRAEWNREGIRQSEMYFNERLRRGRSNIKKYMEGAGANQTLLLGDNLAGEITLKWRLKFNPKYSEMSLELQTDNLSGGVTILSGFEECYRVAAKRFVVNLKSHVLRAAETLMNASIIYSREVVEKANPHGSREYLINLETDYLELATGKRKAGRNRGTFKSPVRRESAAKKFSEKIKRAISNLYLGKAGIEGYCKTKHKGKCLGHDVEEIDRSLVASYLGVSSAAVFGNQLSRHGLNFRSLKKKALENVIK